MSGKEVVIVCEGGVVQCVFTSDPETTVVLVDWDELDPKRGVMSCGGVFPNDRMEDMCRELCDQYEYALGAARRD
jgi:hypothetical protein